MEVSTITFDRFKPLADDACEARIVAAKRALGERAVILGHHYQRADVYKHADLTGDSLRLSKLASQTDAEYIVFCGVHFMAEVADILSKPHQKAILPDLVRRLLDGRHGESRQGRARVARDRRSARSRREGDAGHLHQFGRRPEGVLRRARRHRLHVDQRARDPAVVARAPRESAVLPRPAPRALDRLPHGHPALRDARVGSGRADGRAHAAADQDGEDPAVERPLLGAPDVPGAARAALAPAEPERHGDQPSRVQFRGVQALGLRRLDRFHHQDDPAERARARAGWSAPS